MTEDLFGLPKQIAESRIRELEQRVDELVKRQAKFNKLYNKACYMTAEMAADGEMNADHLLFFELCDAIEEIDNNNFKELPES